MSDKTELISEIVKEYENKIAEKESLIIELTDDVNNYFNSSKTYKEENKELKDRVSQLEKEIDINSKAPEINRRLEQLNDKIFKRLSISREAVAEFILNGHEEELDDELKVKYGFISSELVNNPIFNKWCVETIAAVTIGAINPPPDLKRSQQLEWKELYVEIVQEMVNSLDAAIEEGNQVLDKHKATKEDVPLESIEEN